MGKELSEAAKIARREYKRKWNAEHPEKQKEYEKRFWERKAISATENMEDGNGKETDHKGCTVRGIQTG